MTDILSLIIPIESWEPSVHSYLTYVTSIV